MYTSTQIWGLISVLVILLIIAAFFSASETSLMSLNSYRLKHLAKTNKRARLISELLKRPDRLLGLILIGNTFASIAASAVTTIIGMQLFSEVGVLIATIVLTLIILIFAEVMPKTLGAIKAKQISMLVARPLQWIMLALFPLVWLANAVSNGVLWCFGIKVDKKQESLLCIDELRTVVTEASGLVSDRYKNMLSSILDLEKLTVNDIMVPRTDIIGIDIERGSAEISKILNANQHTLLPVYRDELENVLGIVHMRDVAKLITIQGKDLLKDLSKIYQKPYFVPEGTSLHQQLINFQQNKKRIALVVDEYGDILGLITLEDILEEIVGEFTTSVATNDKEIKLQDDGSYLIDGSVNLRALNRTMGWELPLLEEVKTLSGLLIEQLGKFPEVNTEVLIGNYLFKVIVVQDNIVKLVQVYLQETNIENLE